MPDPLPASSGKLVDFVAPPVSEVVLSVQFPNPVVDIAVLAAFTSDVRDTAPVISHLPILPRMEETFDAPVFAPSFQIIEQAGGLPRTWFAGQDGYLIQLQGDRLTLNWRRTVDGQPYPGYEVIRERFDSHLAQLQHAVRSTGQDLPQIDMCEVAYVNPVEVAGPHETTLPDLASLVNRLRPAPPTGYLGQPEDAQYQARWRIMHPAGSGGRPIGRLYLQASPHIAPDMRTPLYLLNLAAHVGPVREDPDVDSLNVAHEYVVLGFEDLTTPEWHHRWQKREVT